MPGLLLKTETNWLIPKNKISPVMSPTSQPSERQRGGGQKENLRMTITFFKSLRSQLVISRKIPAQYFQKQIHLTNSKEKVDSLLSGVCLHPTKGREGLA
ncbi:hypothetical protein CEXT_581941 [Caerostris extrusa]|uniref:Uncharacterized protein n=1 Tax=Caerostris extrusa TaxID=172846 RepID=A0AAV4R342_CAEEX|nr:hypothetical protein CEXT_581941 [Caerostris extrusa]